MKSSITSLIDKFDTFGISIHQMPNAIGMWENEQECLLWLLLNSNPNQDWLEIGAFCGGSAVLMCLAKRIVGGTGKVISVDNDYKPIFNHNVYTRGKFQDIHVKITCDSSKLQQYYSGEISVAFIDGYHSFSQVITDFKQLQPYLNKDSYIAFHDLSPYIHGEEYFEKKYKYAIRNYDKLMNDSSQNFCLDEAVTIICKTHGYKLVDIPVHDYEDEHPIETGLTEWVRGTTSPFNSFGAIQYES